MKQPRIPWEEKIRRLRDFCRREGRLPGYAEMLAMFGFRSKNAVFGLLERLGREGYVRRESCLKGIDSVRRHSTEDRFFERTIAANGRYHFNLKAANGEVIGTSQMYADAQAMENGIASVRMNAPDATLLNE